jgi:hypothetical protein
MISVICVYNDLHLYNNFIKSSLEKQTVKYELIALDNTNNKFKSAAEALNYGAGQASGKYFMFVHQDIKFNTESWLEGAEKLLDNLEKMGVAGVAGIGNKYLRIVSNIKHGVPPRNAGNIKINNIEQVQTLDECLFIVKKEVYKKYYFDEKICNGWHLYAVDMCLTLQKQGYKNIVLPLEVYHLSVGQKICKVKKIFIFRRLPKEYYDCLKNVIKKHKDSYGFIYTTCGLWDTTRSIFIQKTIITAKDVCKNIYSIFAKIYRYFVPRKN